MRGDVTPAGTEKDAARRREKARRGAVAVIAPTSRKTGGRRLEHYELLLMNNGDFEVVTTLEALLQAVALRLTRKRARRNGAKR